MFRYGRWKKKLSSEVQVRGGLDGSHQNVNPESLSMKVIDGRSRSLASARITHILSTRSSEFLACNSF